MDKIGPYQIVEVVHRGPQPLFRARAKDGHEVAIKAVPVAELTPETRERFTREAETCRRLEHPNLIRVFEMGEADGMLFQAMEMLEGADLGKVMAEGRQLHLGRAARHHGAGLRAACNTRTSISWCIATSSPPISSWKPRGVCVCWISVWCAWRIRNSPRSAPRWAR